MIFKVENMLSIVQLLKFDMYQGEILLYIMLMYNENILLIEYNYWMLKLKVKLLIDFI